MRALNIAAIIIALGLSGYAANEAHQANVHAKYTANQEFYNHIR